MMMPIFDRKYLKMKYLVLLPLLLLSVYSEAQFAKYFKNKTCRLDYFHSGDAVKEFFGIEAFSMEPGWDGPKDNLVDPFDYGSYRFMVYDSATEVLIYSRGYSTLFHEYRTTEEAKTQSASYPETILFPFPRKTVKIEFHSREKDLVWKKKQEVFFNPDDNKEFVKVRKRALPYENFKVHYSGNPKKKLDIVFLPEGYTADQMIKFRNDCGRFAQYLLAASPYDDHLDDINIWGVLAPSEEEGTDLPGDSVWKNTVLNTNFYTFGSERYLTTDDFHAVMDAAACAPSDFTVILVNHDKYGGGGIYNFYCVATADNGTSDFLLVHEFGHSFAGLGDEYYTSDVAYQDFYDLTVEPWEPNITTLVDFGTKWEGLLPQGTPVPTPATEEYKGKLGVFEGGGYVAKGVYRPYLNCTMKDVIYDNFCPVCKRAIEEMIEVYAK